MIEFSPKGKGSDPLIADFLPYLSYVEAAQSHLRCGSIPHPQLIHIALDFVLLAVPFDSSKVIRVGLPGVHLSIDETKLDFEERVEALMMGRSIAHVEHIVAYSPAHRSIVTDRIHGRSLKDLIAHDPAAINNIPLEHYEDLLEVLVKMAAFGLMPDENQDNLLYDPASGFHVIDYITTGITVPAEVGFGNLSYEHMDYKKGALVASVLENFRAHVLLALEEAELLVPHIIKKLERV